MIMGAHVVIFSKDPDADRAFFKDILKFPSVDAGHGWLIFAMPGAEVAFHPAEKNNLHELYFMCDDLKETMESLKKRKVECSPVQEERWGRIIRMKLPGGGEIGIYQPKHPAALGATR
jgi:catechol 2,3-dioxygenase-like lactoylglutathione lyase family enzyme